MTVGLIRFVKGKVISIQPPPLLFYHSNVLFAHCYNTYSTYSLTFLYCNMKPRGVMAKLAKYKTCTYQLTEILLEQNPLNYGETLMSLETGGTFRKEQIFF